jgi:glyoxylase-like metal-dependent hydrolase (beta-lactamase superfamily II)
MAETSRRFSVGDLECILVLDGYHNYPDPVAGFFSNAARGEVEDWLRERGDDPKTWDVYRSPYPALVIFSDEQTILVDCGAGSFDKETGNLLENLAKEGVSADQIDTLVLTHAHPDHIGGLTGQNGPQFPDARHVIQKEEWEFWSTSACEEVSGERMIVTVRESLLPVRDKLELVEGDVEIAPGVRSVFAPGHTPGHMCIQVGSGESSLMYISDLVLVPHHLEKPQWFYRAEIDTTESLATRRRLCAALAKDQMLVQAFHFEWPGFGYFVPHGDTWAWQPTG